MNPPTPAPMIGAIPNATMAETAFPVEYRLGGSSRPMITTPVVNNKLNPTPSSIVSTDSTVGFDTDPHKRNPSAYTPHPSMYTRRSPRRRCSRDELRIVGTSITPPSAVPSPINHAPPPLSAIRSAKKFHAALKPIHTSSAAPRYPQKRGASRNTAPTEPSRPWASSVVGRTRSTVVDHTKTSSAEIANNGIAQPIPLRSRISPKHRHPAAYVRLSQPRMRP